MITVEEAIQIVQEEITPLEKKEEKKIADAVGRVLYEDVLSPINMPPFRQSAMDGYALCLHHEKQYSVVGEVKAGDSHHLSLNPGEAVHIFTGAAVPDTATAIAIRENVLADGNVITLTHAVVIGDHIRSPGEQVLQGNIALRKGTLLTPAAIGYLVSLGLIEVVVYKKPAIAIIGTGNELVEAGNPLHYGQVYESNSAMLSSALYTLGCSPVSVAGVADHYPTTLKFLENAIAENDFVIITGGISVGDYDFVGQALKALSVVTLFYKVKQKPGKPLFFGKKEGTFIFALPGNPGAALNCFYVYVYPALQQAMSRANFHLKRSSYRSASVFSKKRGRAQFLKAAVDHKTVTILEGQTSSMLHTFALANALIYLPERQHKVAVGDMVEVIHLPSGGVV